jgi:large repetitive protein
MNYAGDKMVTIKSPVLLLLAGILLVLAASTQPAQAQTLTPVNPLSPLSPTGSMATARGRHTATLIGNGKVLVTGGFNRNSEGGFASIASAELYAPSKGTFSPTGSMAMAREGHTATLLRKGKVLIAGGTAVDTAELYAPSKGTFSPTGSMATDRGFQTATLLGNGKVLIAGGGSGPSFIPVASAELYDPSSGTFSPTGSMVTAREFHTATLLGNGKVLVAGGNDIAGSGFGTVAGAELYNPSSGTFSPTGSMATAREFHTATLLGNGKVLVAGGFGPTAQLASAELYDPSSGTFSSTGNMVTTRFDYTATLLRNGKVLVVGGRDIEIVELYDPSTETFSSIGRAQPLREGPTATRLDNGQVLIAGGFFEGPFSSAALYKAK